MNENSFAGIFQTRYVSIFVITLEHSWETDEQGRKVAFQNNTRNLRELNVLFSVTDGYPDYQHTPFLFLYSVGRIINFPVQKHITLILLI